jgi:hypothetical protein
MHLQFYRGYDNKNLLYSTPYTTFLPSELMFFKHNFVITNIAEILLF